jgi:hypothetical protein
VEHCSYWVCDGLEEEDAVEALAGPIQPGEVKLLGSDLRSPPTIEEGDSCSEAVPPRWLEEFPMAQVLVDEAIRRCRARVVEVDELLLKRRECEFKLFSTVEQGFVLPRATKGFPTVEAFIQYAGEVTNRRKARAGRSLELHLVRIFKDASMAFTHGGVTEEKKRPDFLFPSVEAYHDDTVAPDRLRMLAAKTTCKDRWRQVCTEAKRIPMKHLLTVQEGVSEPQFKEMQGEGVILVVPRRLHASFPSSIRSKLRTLEDFISEIRELQSHRATP